MLRGLMVTFEGEILQVAHLECLHLGGLWEYIRPGQIRLCFAVVFILRFRVDAWPVWTWVCEELTPKVLMLLFVSLVMI